MKKLRKLMLSSHAGMSNIMTLIIFMSAMMFLVALLVAASIFVKQNVVTTALKKSITICERANLDKQYTSLIEAESYDQTINYNSTAYTGAFFSSLKESFSHDEETGIGSGHTYLVSDKNGNYAFTVQNVNLSISVIDRPMFDTKEKRLAYAATGTLIIPLSAFGYTANINLPVKATASFQYTG